MAVTPSRSTTERMSSMIERPVAASSWPVGSSARRSLRPVDQRAGDGDALLLAAGELVRSVPSALRQADQLERVHDAIATFVGVGAAQAQRQLDVLGRREDGDEAERLEDVGDLLATETDVPGLVERGHLLAVHHDAAGWSGGRGRR